jgi:hypothetical protein
MNDLRVPCTVVLSEPQVSRFQIFPSLLILLEKLVELDRYVMAQTFSKEGKSRENMAAE